MKNSPYLRWFLVGLSWLVMWFLNAIIAPCIYPWVNKIRHARTPFLIWFVNTDEPTDFENNYGDLGFLKRKGIDILNSNAFMRWIYYINWCVIRNSFWYFKTHVFIPYPAKPDSWKTITNTTEHGHLHLCNYNDRGLIWTEYWINERKYFRYSFTKEIRLFFVFGKRIWNVQLGSNGIGDTNRYLFKSKITKLT